MIPLHLLPVASQRRRLLFLNGKPKLLRSSFFLLFRREEHNRFKWQLETEWVLLFYAIFNFSFILAPCIGSVNCSLGSTYARTALRTCVFVSLLPRVSARPKEVPSDTCLKSCLFGLLLQLLVLLAILKTFFPFTHEAEKYLWMCFSARNTKNMSGGVSQLHV